MTSPTTPLPARGRQATDHDRPRADRYRDRDEDDSGSVTVELVFVLPLLFTIILVLAQVAVWAHATHIAQASAAQALSATRADGGSVAAGQDAARAVLDQLGPALETPEVQVSRDAARATVRVSGTASSVVPGLDLPVHAEAAGPVEIRR